MLYLEISYITLSWFSCRSIFLVELEFGTGPESNASRIRGSGALSPLRYPCTIPVPQKVLYNQFRAMVLLLSSMICFSLEYDYCSTLCLVVVTCEAVNNCSGHGKCSKVNTCECGSGFKASLDCSTGLFVFFSHRFIYAFDSLARGIGKPPPV